MGKHRSPKDLQGIFEEAHRGAAELYSWDWFEANRAAVHLLAQAGFDITDPVVKAVASLAIRAALRKVLLPRIEKTP